MTVYSASLNLFRMFDLKSTSSSRPTMHRKGFDGHVMTLASHNCPHPELFPTSHTLSSAVSDTLHEFFAWSIYNCCKNILRIVISMSMKVFFTFVKHPQVLLLSTPQEWQVSSSFASTIQIQRYSWNINTEKLGVLDSLRKYELWEWKQFQTVLPTSLPSLTPHWLLYLWILITISLCLLQALQTILTNSLILLVLMQIVVRDRFRRYLWV